MPADDAPGTGGSVDLGEMLRSLNASRRPGIFTICTVAGPEAFAATVGQGVEAIVAETEGVTVIATVEAARRRGWAVGFEAAWLTLDVHSALEAVGLTAAVSAAFTNAGIPCNVLAGFYHDHLLVPFSRVDDALDCLAALRTGA